MHVSEKSRFVILWGMLGWGFTTALALILFDRYKTHHSDTPARIVGRFVIFMAGGIVWGLCMWSWRGKRARREIARAQQIGQTVLFFALMLGLLFVLFRYF